MKGNEHIRGLISWDYVFQKRHARHTNNMFQYMTSANVCQVLMFVNAKSCQGVLGHVRDYKECQHMIGECYAMLWHANMCLGILLMARCSRYKDVPRHVRCQGMLVYCSKAC